MKLLNWNTVFVLIILFLFSLMVNGEENVKISFQPEVEVLKERMYLGEIAIIEGEGELVERLKNIDLGPAPLPGGRFTLAPDTILSILKQHGIDIEMINFTNLSHKGIVVKRAAQLLDQKMVMQLVEDYIYRQLSRFNDIRINLVRGFPEIRLPMGDYQVKVGPYQGGELRGYISLPVTIFIDGKVYKRIYLNLEVQIYESVFVTLKPIERKTIITSDMIELRYMDITRISGEPVFSEEELIGKETKRSLSEGTVLLKEYLTEPELIHRNDQVLIVANYGVIHIQTIGRALEDGAKGEWIWVENISSGKKILAMVTDVGQVQVKVE
ncbi:flagella basal body P-ring formation protein FlgA [Anoxybacter fermentans]|uniref:Flagella basal body P-ring formation protein FlgA n=1 Tax=Anoxybacter fermentans TaxID=1323375 RepID=A0A3Q9HRT4_9FIRM|nr:flagellar basal body P-ring formation chaperone FlgA [Anoxybacter fermentans]AZR73849.1 flagella basal body P-ring formation protein FlgA [Anoxybacter fermentans]